MRSDPAGRPSAAASPQPSPAPRREPVAVEVGELAHLLSHAERRLVRRLNSVLAEVGCTLEQWRVLSAVGDGAGHPMTEIADHALMPAPSLTKLVDAMVADNLVYRRPDPGDRRRVLLQLAARGRTLHRRAARRLAEDAPRLSPPAGGLAAEGDTAGDSELASLVQALDQLTAALGRRGPLSG
ncbi:MarR family winged helix-turn-helix transcriptional regulator [Streptomyces sp. CA-111067]|uniref:MarR family winged helix-turn-helix transcriptional regulator n=1 Tax=Streptomyces sp. CA-111067 TaxID=3240046 RepID=UPI003D9556D0